MATTSDAAVLLSLHLSGSAARADLEVAQASSGPSDTTAISVALEGTHHSSTLALHHTTLSRVILGGTLSGSVFSAVLAMQGGEPKLQLHFVKSSAAAFHAAVTRIASAVAKAKHSPDAKRTAAELVAAELTAAMTSLDKVARALTSDAAALAATYATDASDLHNARSASASLTTALSRTPAPSHSVVCTEVTSLKKRMTAVADDDEFLAGFISGLVMSEGDVAKDATTVKAVAAHLRTLLSTGSLWLGTVIPTKGEVTTNLHDAGAALATAQNTTTSVVNKAQASLTKLFVTADAVITSSACGATLAAPSPFSLPRHA